MVLIYFDLMLFRSMTYLNRNFNNFLEDVRYLKEVTLLSSALSQLLKQKYHRKFGLFRGMFLLMKVVVHKPT